MFNEPVKKRQYNEQLFARIAAKYNLLNRILSFDADRKWKARLAAMLPEANTPTCLDVACGTGDITAVLRKKYPHSKIIGLDISEEMLDIARSRKDCPDIDFIRDDICELPFDDNTFDIVTACYAIRNAPDINKSLREIIRATKPGGTVCIMDFSKPPNKTLQQIECLFLKLWFGFWSYIFYRDTQPYGYVARSLKAFPDSPSFKKTLSQTGYRITAARKYAFGMIEIIACTKP